MQAPLVATTSAVTARAALSPDILARTWKRPRQGDPQEYPKHCLTARHRPNSAMLVIDDLLIKIGDRRLLDGASAQVPIGARVGLVGRNGAGKTTLFKALAG